MTEFTVNGVNYRSTGLNAMTQFHVVRRLTPVITGLNGMFSGAASGEDVDLIGIIKPLADAVAKMSDEDSEFIISRCMAVTQRQESQGSGWANVWNESAKMPMYADIDMNVLLRICFNVLRDNLAPFIAGLRRG